MISHLNRLVGRGLILATCFIVSLKVQAQPQNEQNATAWLDNMASAVKQLNYQASFVLLKQNAQAEPYLWRHGMVDGVSMEHLSLLNGPGREIVRIGDRVNYFEPNVPSHSIVSDSINGPFPSALFRAPLTHVRGYDYVMVGRSRVAGRAAQQIRIVSQDKNRYGVNLWLDQETALPLKMDMLDIGGKLVEQWLVTGLAVTSEPDPYFFRIKQAQLPPPIPNAQAMIDLDWRFSWLPKGMQVIKRDAHRLPLTGSPVDYVMLSDGLIDVSVYMQRVEGTVSSQTALQHQSDTLFTMSQGPIEVTIVGKLPANTAHKIASGIALVTVGQ